MVIYTIGFTKKSAREFFESICTKDIQLLIDIRLNNTSQLSGFSKGNDLEYFLEKICSVKYQHDLLFSPTKAILDDFKSGKIDWLQYEKYFTTLMQERNAISHFIERYSTYQTICLLCSERTAKLCHRRLVAEMLEKSLEGTIIKHIT